jgi:thymidylate synthase
MIIVSEQDYDQVLELYKLAKTTPVIKMTTDPEVKDWSEQAWDRVRDKMDELGQKYGYDPSTHAINKDRQVIPVGDVP